MFGKNLHRAQFVARTADSNAFVQRPYAHHFELAQHGQTIMGDRRADTRDHGVKTGQGFPVI